MRMTFVIISVLEKQIINEKCPKNACICLHLIKKTILGSNKCVANHLLIRKLRFVSTTY